MTTEVMSPLERIAEEVNKSEEGRNPQKALDFINRYLISIGKSPFLNLDNITSKSMTAGLAKSLGLDNEIVRQMQQRLVKLGIFSADLDDPRYTAKVRTQIIDNIVNNISTPHFLSFYIDVDYNDHTENNRRVIAQSRQMKEYLAGLGLSNLDDVNYRHSSSGLGSVLGFKKMNPRQMQQRLAELGAFSPNLANYSANMQKRIIKKIIDNVSNHAFLSFYLNPDNKYCERNRRAVARSGVMKEYLASLGLSNLDDFSRENMVGGLARLMRSEGEGARQIRKKLAELGTFSSNLADYTTEGQDRIIGNIIENISNSNFSTFYLEFDNKFAESNRSIIAQSRQMKGYLAGIGVSHLDEVNSEDATSGLGRILGFNQGNPRQMKKRLVELGTFPSNLADEYYNTGPREKVCQNLIDILHTWKTSYYISMVDGEILRTNRQVILASKAVQEFFAGQGYDINNPGRMTHDVRLFFNRYINDPVTQKEGREQPAFRIISKKWTPEEEQFLANVFRECGQSEEDYIQMLHQNRAGLQERLGVSYRAIISKSQNLGLISKNEPTGSRENTAAVYAFPRIHGEEFPDEVVGFERYAVLLNQDVIPAVTLGFLFESAIHQQHNVATLPIYYKGINMKDYTSAEQVVLSGVFHYISDNLRFERKQNGDLVIDPSVPHEFNPVILDIKGADKNFLQLAFRKRFNPGNKAGTAAIDIGNGNEIYLFQHQRIPTYQNTRT